MKDAYNRRSKEITEKAALMRDVLINPIIDGASGNLIKDKATRDANLAAKTSGSIFESAGPTAGRVHGTAANAVLRYTASRGKLPSDEQLASAYQAIENSFEVYSGKATPPGGMVLETADMSTTEGLLMRDRLIGLILPVMLNSVCGNLVSFIPGTYNQSEVFKLNRVAGSTFGDITAGQQLNFDYQGQYSSMDQRYLAATGDGSIRGTSDEFKLDSNVKFSAVHPFKKKSIKIFHDHNQVAKDDGAGNISGSFVVGVTTITVTGTVVYSTGVVNPVFSTAPALGIDVHIGFDVDIEKAPTLIPLVNTEMDSRVLYPHEAAISADTTLQALWAIRRELDLNSEQMATTSMRNLLAADKDRKVLRDLYFFAKGEETWDRTAADNAADIGFYWKGLLEALLTVDATLLARTGTSGLAGIVADTKSTTIFRSMPAPYFKPAPGYKSIPQPHYVGILFDTWELYTDPAATDYTNLCYAKGRGIGEAGYVMGDAIPAMSFRHAIQRDLTYKNTMWELAYRDLQPFVGREYFMRLLINVL
jgi:hypothetical protein